MRILLIHNRYRYAGGEETYTHNLTRLLRSHGHTVIRYEKDTGAVKKWQKPFIIFHFFWNFAAARQLDKLVTEKKPDVAFIQNLYPLLGPSVYWTLKRNRIPIIQHITNYRLVCPKTLLFRNNRICELCVSKKIPYPSVLYGCYNSSRFSSLVFTLSFAFHRYILNTFSLVDRYVFPTEFIRDYIATHFPVSKDRGKLLPTFTFPYKARLNSRVSAGPYFLYAGRLSEEKGILKLINLFKTKGLRNCLLNIAGDGPLRNAVISSIKNHPNMVYRGTLSQTDVLTYMRGARAVIMPSLWYDVLPNVAMESFAAGTPLLAPHIGIFPHIIEQGKNGFTYRTDSELVTHIKTMSSQKKIHRKPQKPVDNDLDFTPAHHYKVFMQTVHEISGNR